MSFYAYKASDLKISSLIHLDKHKRRGKYIMLATGSNLTAILFRRKMKDGINFFKIFNGVEGGNMHLDRKHKGKDS